MTTAAAVAPCVYSPAWCDQPTRWPSLRTAWLEGLARWMPDNLYAHPDWCAALEAAQPGSVRLLLLRSADQIEVVVPFLLKPAPLEIQAGRYNLFALHPRTLRLSGDELHLGDDAALHQAFWAALQPQPHASPRAPQFDLLHLSLPADSPLWSGLRQLRLRPYGPAAPGTRDLIVMPPSFDAYLAKFGAKSRKNRLRELKQLRQHGPLELQTFCRPGDAAAFLEIAVPLSRRTYQDKFLDAGLHRTEHLRPRIETAAQNGWLRSYILRCRGEACAYMLGYQYEGRYFYAAIGYDPQWKAYGVGTALHLLAMEEMFAHHPPRLFDLGPSMPQKRYFANHQVATRTVLLFRPGLYPWFARNLHRTASAALHHGRQLSAALSASRRSRSDRTGARGDGNPAAPPGEIRVG